jgi:hypothetical protein
MNSWLAVALGLLHELVHREFRSSDMALPWRKTCEAKDVEVMTTTATHSIHRGSRHRGDEAGDRSIIDQETEMVVVQANRKEALKNYQGRDVRVHVRIVKFGSDFYRRIVYGNRTIE